MMRRRLLLSVLLASLAATGCVFKGQRNAAGRSVQPLPSPLAKAPPPPKRDLPPTPPPAPSPAATAANTLPDESEYKAVPIPAAPQPLDVVPTAARAAEPDASDDEKKRLLERLREKREERRDERAKDAPKPATAAKDAPAQDAKTDGLTAAKKLYAMAYAKYEKTTDSEVVMTRREVVGGRETPTEEILLQFRKQPFSIYMRNVGENGKGREVLYVEGKFDNLMHVVTGKGDNVLIGAGFKTSLAPDSRMATSKSRHKITEAGPGHLLVRLDKHIKAAEAGQRTIKSLGTVTRKDQPAPVEGLEIAVPPGDDPNLPKGGKWSLFFDTKADSPTYGYLMLHTLVDETNREVEYYSFAKWRSPANLTDADFHPDRLGKKK